MVGMAVAIIVTSRATRKVVVHKDRKIRKRLVPVGYSVFSVVLEVSCSLDDFSKSWSDVGVLLIASCEESCSGQCEDMREPYRTCMLRWQTSVREG